MSQKPFPPWTCFQNLNKLLHLHPFLYLWHQNKAFHRFDLEQDVEEEPVAEPATDTTETPTTDAPQNVEETTTDGNTETTTEGNLESTTDNNDEMEQVD